MPANLESKNGNLLIGLAPDFSILLLARLIATLMDSEAGEQAAALGAVVGGIIGAGGPVLAVFLTLDCQRREEREKARTSLRTEVCAYTKYVIGVHYPHYRKREVAIC